MSAGIFFILKYFPEMVFLCPSDRQERGEKKKRGRKNKREVIVLLLGGD